MKMRRLLRLSLLTLLALCCGSHASAQPRGRARAQPPPAPAPSKERAATVRMRNGDRVRGSFAGASTDTVTMTVGGSAVSLRLDEIASIDFAEGSEVAAPPAGASAPALKALQKLRGAAEVGVTFEEYGRLVVDAKAEVDRAASGMPDGDAKAETLAAMSAYADALQAWNELRRRGGRYETLGVDDDSFTRELQRKYDIPYETLGSPPVGPMKIMSKSAILTTIWRAAAARVARSAELLK